MGHFLDVVLKFGEFGGIWGLFIMNERKEQSRALNYMQVC
jgi:hypothetical protein